MLEAILCLAEAIYFEGRSQPVMGQYAIGYVITNRVADDRYPDNPCGVIRHGGTRRNNCQFSYYCDGKPERFYDKEAYGKALINASIVYFQIIPDPTLGSTHYHANYVQPFWAITDPVTIINKHLFYRL
jgi:spore germination cell wall hydrolase CwlJ-like protein